NFDKEHEILGSGAPVLVPSLFAPGDCDVGLRPPVAPGLDRLLFPDRVLIPRQKRAQVPPHIVCGPGQGRDREVVRRALRHLIELPIEQLDVPAVEQPRILDPRELLDRQSHSTGRPYLDRAHEILPLGWAESYPAAIRLATRFSTHRSSCTHVIESGTSTAVISVHLTQSYAPASRR